MLQVVKLKFGTIIPILDPLEMRTNLDTLGNIILSSCRCHFQLCRFFLKSNVVNVLFKKYVNLLQPLSSNLQLLPLLASYHLAPSSHELNCTAHNSLPPKDSPLGTQPLRVEVPNPLNKGSKITRESFLHN